jgi:hypothetical protein
MYPQILLNGTPYRHLHDLPRGFAARIDSFASQPIWENLPKDAVLHISVSNATAKTWPTTEARHLPTISPPSVSTNASADTLDEPTQRAAMALVDLYASHYAADLSDAEADSLKTNVQEDLAKTTRGGGRVSLAPSTDTGSSPAMNATLKVDGSGVHLRIPQRLRVEIARDNSSSASNVDARRLLMVEVRRVVHYTVTERVDVSVEDEEMSSETGWTNETPAPPLRQVKAFKDAVVGMRPMYDPGRLLTQKSRTQILTVVAIMTAMLVCAAIVVAMLR